MPPLTVRTVEGSEWELAARNPKDFTFIFFYRGLHCPVCGKYLKNIDQRIGELPELGIDAIAISSDAEERAQRSKEKWRMKGLPIGYGLPIETAREWGLYVSKAIKEGEPGEFSESALFIVRDGALRASAGATSCAKT